MASRRLRSRPCCSVQAVSSADRHDSKASRRGARRPPPPAVRRQSTVARSLTAKLPPISSSGRVCLAYPYCFHFQSQWLGLRDFPENYVREGVGKSFGGLPLLRRLTKRPAKGRQAASRGLTHWLGGRDSMLVESYFEHRINIAHKDMGCDLVLGAAQFSHSREQNQIIERFSWQSQTQRTRF